MAWLSRDKDNNIWVSIDKPVRDERCPIWKSPDTGDTIDWDNSSIDYTQWGRLPLDADEKLIGRHLTWEDEPVEI